MKKAGSILGILAFLGAPAALAEERPESSRMAKRYGLYLGLIGDPFPTIFGLNLAAHAADFLRVTAGWGRITADSHDVDTGEKLQDLTADTVGVGVKFLAPGRNFTPVVGINWATVSVQGTATNTSGDVGGFEEDGNHFYVNAGVDWVSKGGFNLGGGYNFSLKENVGGIPYLNVGAFF